MIKNMIVKDVLRLIEMFDTIGAQNPEQSALIAMWRERLERLSEGLNEEEELDPNQGLGRQMQKLERWVVVHDLKGFEEWFEHT